jgi:predicted DCC family thiol-disulfide oxidoreductase YuxK
MPISRLTVWYNTRCPVCNGGIGWQRGKLLAAVRAGHIAFKDINEQPDALAAYGASVDDVRRRLHATDQEGRLVVGADVAIAVWRMTPGEGWLATMLGNPRDAAGHALWLCSLRGFAVCVEQAAGALVKPKRVGIRFSRRWRDSAELAAVEV